MTLPFNRNNLADSDHKPARDHIGRKLAEWRERARLTQKEAAELLGVAGENTISRWETGERTPGSDVVARAHQLYQSRWGYFEKSLLPPGKVREGHEPYRAREARVQAFEREMIRLGADDFEADHVRERALSFLESIHSQGGTNEDEELATYLEYSLRPWVLRRIEQRREREAK